jgi:DpnII restriction endonuclease
MTCEDILASRLAVLRAIIRRSYRHAPEQVQGFITRVLRREDGAIDGGPLYPETSVDDCLAVVRFGGYPSLAKAGYCLAHKPNTPFSEDAASTFLHGIERQRERPAATQAQLAGDAMALLGISDGLRAISKAYPTIESLEAAKSWLRGLLEQHGGSDTRFNRARLLASDLLDEQGRFGHQLAQADDLRVAVLDLCLWQSWPGVLRNVGLPDTDKRRELFKRLLTDLPPNEGELLHAASWLCGLDVLTDEIVALAVPDANQVVRILAATQGSFRRWRWEEKAIRNGVMPARWLIDKEADIQAFLLAVLYPYFGDQLQDEQYLQGFGLRQGRFDFAITNLGLIVEVKVVRTSNDINNLEAQIADDLSLYFKEGNPFESMVAYVYDDRDRPEPEMYPVIQDALKRRSDRIVDVVVVQRPSMIPKRGQRQ